MAMDLLNQLSHSPLPAVFRTPAEVDKVKLLRAAGLVIALTPSNAQAFGAGADSAPTDAVQVLAITAKGHEELAKFAFPGEVPPAPPHPGRIARWKAKLNGISQHVQ